jgi:ATP-dependent DNA helicase RecQ
MGRPPILALTATASPAVRAEIVELLGLHDPVVIARSFDRPNIELAVSRHAGTASKREALGAWVAAAAAPGIVYAATRRGAEEIARLLVAKALEAEAYHAGLGAKRRAGIQERFMSGTLPIVVATIAFGMGVDKPDVRFVAHADISDTIEAYHQEIGRAGRDGKPALARLFHDPADLGLRRFQGVPPPLKDAQVRAAIRAIRNGARTRETIAAGARLSGRRAELIIGRLEARGAIDIAPSGAIEVRDLVEDGSLVGEVVADQERLRTHATTRVELLRGYAETEGCRRRFLLNALGEEYEPPCGHCDNCRSGAAARSAADADANVAFALEDRVSHAGFGLGTVSRVEGDRVTVRFDTAGYRTISLRQATEGGVLQRAE